MIAYFGLAPFYQYFTNMKWKEVVCDIGKKHFSVRVQYPHLTLAIMKSQRPHGAFAGVPPRGEMFANQNSTWIYPWSAFPTPEHYKTHSAHHKKQNSCPKTWVASLEALQSNILCPHLHICNVLPDLKVNLRSSSCATWASCCAFCSSRYALTANFSFSSWSGVNKSIGTENVAPRRCFGWGRDGSDGYPWQSMISRNALLGCDMTEHHPSGEPLATFLAMLRQVCVAGTFWRHKILKSQNRHQIRMRISGENINCLSALNSQAKPAHATFTGELRKCHVLMPQFCGCARQWCRWQWPGKTSMDLMT